MNKPTSGSRVRFARIATHCCGCAWQIVRSRLLVLVALAGDWVAFVRFVVVPATGFTALSVFRRYYDAPRPYEVLAIDPLIEKDTMGHSFPSRHTFSLMMIACSWCVWNVWMGVVQLRVRCDTRDRRRSFSARCDRRCALRAPLCLRGVCSYPLVKKFEGFKNTPF